MAVLRRISQRLDRYGRLSFQVASPEYHFGLHSVLLTGPISAQARGDYPNFAKMMIEYDQAGIESDVALREFQVIQCGSTQFRLYKILQVVSPEAKTTAQRKWQIHLVEEFESAQKVFENYPRISK